MAAAVSRAGKGLSPKDRPSRCSATSQPLAGAVLICALLSAGSAFGFSDKKQLGPGRVLAQTIVRLALAGQIPALFGPPRPVAPDPRRCPADYVAQDRKLARSVVRKALLADHCIAPGKTKRVLAAMFDAPLTEGSAPTHGFQSFPLLIRALQGEGKENRAIAKLRKHKDGKAAALLDKATARLLFRYEITERSLRKAFGLFAKEIDSREINNVFESTKLPELLHDEHVRFKGGEALWAIEEASFAGKRVKREVLRKALETSGADPQRIDGFLDALYAAPLGRTGPRAYERARKQDKSIFEVAPGWAVETPGVAWPWTLILDSQAWIGAGRAFLSESNGGERLVQRHTQMLNSMGEPEHDCRTTKVVQGETEGWSVAEMLRFVRHNATSPKRWPFAMRVAKAAASTLIAFPPWKINKALEKHIVTDAVMGAPEWKAVYAELCGANVGGGQKNGSGKHKLDVDVAAEAMGVPHFSNYLPVLVMQDKQAVNQLLRLADPKTWGKRGPGKPAHEVYPIGVPLTIDGRSVQVDPAPIPRKSGGGVQEIADYLTWRGDWMRLGGSSVKRVMSKEERKWAFRMVQEFPSLGDEPTIWQDYLESLEAP